MAIEHSIAKEGETLVVRAWGFDESLQEVIAYGEAIVEAAREQGCRRVLVDETELEYRLDTMGTFDLARHYAEKFRFLGRCAVVAAPENMEDAKFWEDAVRNRGLNYRVFASSEAAREWLDKT